VGLTGAVLEQKLAHSRAVPRLAATASQVERAPDQDVYRATQTVNGPAAFHPSALPPRFSVMGMCSPWWKSSKEVETADVE